MKNNVVQLREEKTFQEHQHSLLNEFYRAKNRSCNKRGASEMLDWMKAMKQHYRMFHHYYDLQ